VAVEPTGYLIGVDVGGTFTDVVVVDPDGEVSTYKAFTTPGDEAQGVFDSLGMAADSIGRPLTELLGRTDRFVHGTTIGANALLEKRGARTGVISTRGFRDTLVMRRMLRENMYDLRAKVPENFLRREWVFEVDERVDRRGEVVTPLDVRQVEELVPKIRELELEAIAVSLLFSFRNPVHEHTIRDILRRELPEVFTVASADIAPEIRDYERASTTALSAYLGPRVANYLLDLEERLRGAGLNCHLQVLRSSGGVCTAAEAAGQPVDTLLSGPAGGVVAAMSTRGAHGDHDLITFDMGGTSCDLSVVRSGRATSSAFLPRHTRFEGWDVLRPFLDIHALGAGGGSIAWLDQAGGLHVGPRSASAVPGPACYGRGGTEPTVTDANVRLGYFNPTRFLHSDTAVDAELAERALASIGEQLGYDTVQAASGIFRIVNAAMADAVRVVLADKGFHAKDFALLCFGGAGAIHAPAVMRDLGVSRLIVLPEAAAFSALGLILSDIRYDLVRSVGRGLLATSFEAIEGLFGAMRSEAEQMAGVGSGSNGSGPWHFDRAADMRYAGQVHELRVAVPDQAAAVHDIQSVFEDSYSTAYGFLNDPERIQLLNLRLSLVGETPKPKPRQASDASPVAAEPSGEREAYFDELEGWAATPVFASEELPPGSHLDGPGIVDLPFTTIVVRPDQHLAVDPAGAFIVTEGRQD
jgi:N-methylhydantoinase A